MHFTLLLLLSSSIFCCNSLEVLEILPNIGYLLRGYHLYHGNPLATQVTADPGFLHHIFKPTYDLNLLSEDNKYLVPDGTQSHAKEGCTQAFNHEILQSSDEYKRLLRDMVKTNYTGFDHSFKGSSDYQRIYKAHSEDKSTEMLLTQIICSKYEAYLNVTSPPVYSSLFVNGLRIIIAADQRNKSDTEGMNLLIHNFLNTYGTHFVRKIEYGSRLNFQSSLTSLDRRNLLKAGVDMKAGAVLSMTEKMGHTLTEEELKNSQIFNKLISDRKSSSSSTYSDKGLLDVLNSIPIPLFYEIDRMDSIFVKSLMRKVDIHYKRLKQLFDSYFTNYCENEKYFNGDVDRCPAKNSYDNSALAISKNNFKVIFANSKESDTNSDDTTSSNNGILSKKKLPKMTAITISWWMKTTPYSSNSLKRRHIVSYNKNGNMDLFKILAATEEEGACLKLQLGGETILDKSKCLIPFDGNYHHYVVIWANTYGRWHVFIDGNIVAGGSNARNFVIPAGGYLVIGQQYESGNVSTNPLTMFSGEIAYLNIWDYALNGVEAKNLASRNGQVQGNIVEWNQSELKLINGDGLDVRAVINNDEFFRVY